MSPAARLLEDDNELLAQLVASEGDGPDLETRLEIAQLLRGRSRDRARAVDQFLLEALLRHGRGLAEARHHLAQMRELLDNALAPPWLPALFLWLLRAEAGRSRAAVWHGGMQRVVNVADGVDPEALRLGEEVFLSKELNLIVGRSPNGVPRSGETAVFDRGTGDGRAVLKWRDEEVVVDLADVLRETPLESGDAIRWDRASWVAFEKLERPAGRQFLLQEVADVHRDQIGGQDAHVDAVLEALTATLVAPERAARYVLGNRHSVLLWGPPGNGKTLTAKLAAAEITRLSGKRCRIAVVKPSAWESPWVGETQRNIRECFAALRAAAAQGEYAILFLDEIESIGRIRGHGVDHHADKFLACLLAELDGFTDRHGVAIVSATNRKDLVDPALLERLSDLEVAMPRPDMRGARAIFAIHLPAAIPYHPNGASAPETRQALIDCAVSRFYSPNADNELCILRFRDGTTRTVAARELASGRTFEQICRAARRSAFLRDVRGGDPGVCVDDVDAAVADVLERLATTLTLRNARAYLSDLPQDVDVVSAEPVRRKVRRARAYLNGSPT